MELNFSLQDHGLKVKHQEKNYHLIYPKKIWQSYPQQSKEFLFDNLAHLLTINSPLVKEEKQVNYNTSPPLFKSFFHQVVLNSLPHAVEDYHISTHKIIKQFLNTAYQFKDLKVKIPFYQENTQEKAIISLSCGKDSLLSLGLAQELGLKPIGIYINDTVSPPENKLKLNFLNKISKENKIKILKVTNQLEKLNDFETWDKDETCLGYTHMLTGFSFIALPFNHYFKAAYTIVGNQANMNFRFLNKDGFLTYPAFDQTRQWMKQQNIMLGLTTTGKVKLLSLIEPLTNLAIMKILHHRYKKLGKYEISCDCLDYSKEKRWCHNCNKCCRLHLMMKAVGADTKTVGFHQDLLKKKFKKYYILFKGKQVDAYEKSPEARDEQLFSFYLAYKQGVKGELMNLFKKKFLTEAKQREQELHQKFFGLGEMTSIPEKLKPKLKSLLQEELGKF